MNLQQIASKHGVKLSQLKALADANKWDIDNISEEREKQLIEQLKNQNSANKQLPQTNLLTNTQNLGEVSTNNQQGEDINIQNIGVSEIQKIINAQKFEGESLAQLASGVKVEAFVNSLKQTDAALFNALINQSLANTIQIKHLTNQIAQINGSSDAEIIDVKTAIAEHKQAQFESQDLVTQYLLPASEQSDWVI